MEKENIQTQDVLPVNRRVKDSFFKTVYSSGKRLAGLARFLLGVQDNNVRIANVRPVMFGNRENDLSFLCGDVFYCMVEEESGICPNMPYCLLEYITAGLRSTVDSEKILYSSKRVCFPVPKLYMVQAGMEDRKQEITRVQYDIYAESRQKQEICSSGKCTRTGGTVETSEK